MSVGRVLFALLLIRCNASKNKDSESPLYVPSCYRNDPDFNACLLRSTELLRPQLIEGIPDFEVLPLSPHFIPYIRFAQTNNEANYVYLARNVVVTGLDSYSFTSFKFDLDKLKLVASFKIDLFNLKGDSSVNGQLLGVPVEGDGFFSFTITNSSGTIKQLLNLTTRNGVTYLEPMFDITKINIGAFSYEYGYNHEGNTLFARTTDRAIYDYEAQWTEYFKTVIEKELVEIIINGMIKNLYKVPYNELFPIR